MDNVTQRQADWARRRARLEAAGRRWRKDQVWAALAAYAPARDLTALGAPEVCRSSPAAAARWLGREARTLRVLRAQGHPAFTPARMRLVLAAWIAEQRRAKASLDRRGY